MLWNTMFVRIDKKKPPLNYDLFQICLEKGVTLRSRSGHYHSVILDHLCSVYYHPALINQTSALICSNIEKNKCINTKLYDNSPSITNIHYNRFLAKWLWSNLQRQETWWKTCALCSFWLYSITIFWTSEYEIKLLII